MFQKKNSTFQGHIFDKNLKRKKLILEFIIL